MSNEFVPYPNEPTLVELTKKLLKEIKELEMILKVKGLIKA